MLTQITANANHCLALEVAVAVEHRMKAIQQQNLVGARCGLGTKGRTTPRLPLAGLASLNNVTRDTSRFGIPHDTSHMS